MAIVGSGQTKQSTVIYNCKLFTFEWVWLHTLVFKRQSEIKSKIDIFQIRRAC